ncbi:DinB family protein [Caulobacter sp.]|uniref:DinB family protein n=1 Tax=Caulobacter sp. TaxID=78 RepID=UPI0031CFD060
MSMLDHARRMARYNSWMNRKVYDAAKSLAPAELAADRGAFFGSVLGTLNHLIVGDTFWMRALSGHSKGEGLARTADRMPLARSLNHILFRDMAELEAHRHILDAGWQDFVDQLTEADMNEMVAYPSGRYGALDCDAFALLCHVFNHQTHHRGQVSTLLTQAGLDIGSTDLLVQILNDAANRADG